MTSLLKCLVLTVAQVTGRELDTHHRLAHLFRHYHGCRKISAVPFLRRRLELGCLKDLGHSLPIALFFEQAFQVIDFLEIHCLPWQWWSVQGSLATLVGTGLDVLLANRGDPFEQDLCSCLGRRTFFAARSFLRLPLNQITLL